jgi:hypothetical protein
LVLSLPFLLFAFVTTLLNHIEFKAVDPNQEANTVTEQLSSQKPAQAAG